MKLFPPVKLGWLTERLFPVGPIRCKCGAADWKVYEDCDRINSGFYHHGALGRNGRVCNRCYRIEYFETDQSFYDRLPKWLKLDPELKVPDGVKRMENSDKEIQNGKPIQTIDLT